MRRDRVAQGPAGDEAGQWSTTFEVWARDVDYLGHLTAVAYPVVYEEAFYRFLAQRWGLAEPSFVMAALEVRYLHEVVLSASPITVAIGIDHVGRSSFRTSATITDAAGTLCSTSSTRYVAWDRAARGARPLTDHERQSLRLYRSDEEGGPRR